jgi:hypothetical protein
LDGNVCMDVLFLMTCSSLEWNQELVQTTHGKNYLKQNETNSDYTLGVGRLTPSNKQTYLYFKQQYMATLETMYNNWCLEELR